MLLPVKKNVDFWNFELVILVRLQENLVLLFTDLEIEAERRYSFLKSLKWFLAELDIKQPSPVPFNFP